MDTPNPHVVALVQSSDLVVVGPAALIAALQDAQVDADYGSIVAGAMRSTLRTGDQGVVAAGYRGIVHAGYRGIAVSQHDGRVLVGAHGIGAGGDRSEVFAGHGSIGVGMADAKIKVGKGGVAVAGVGGSVWGEDGAVLAVMWLDRDAVRLATGTVGVDLRAECWYAVVKGKLEEQ